MQSFNIRRQIRKSLPLDMHVILQRLFHSNGLDGGDDGFLFREGAVHAVAHVQLQATTGLEDDVLHA